MSAPPNDETPGVGRGFLPLWEYVLMLVEALYDHFHASSGGQCRRRYGASSRERAFAPDIARHLARMMSRQPVRSGALVTEFHRPARSRRWRSCHWRCAT